jgi:predicted small metal-binding protein
VVGDGVQARGDVGWGCGFVEGAVEGREEVVDVAVEGCDAERMRTVFEEERVDKWTVL